MRLYQQQEYHSVHDRDSGAVFSEVEFRDCYFQGCTISIAGKPATRSIVRKVRMVNCSQRGCTIHAGVFEDVLVDGLKTNGQLLQCWAAVFNRVVLRGKIDRLMTSSAVSGGLATPEEQTAFDRANADYYARVDWALDISEGDFKELEIRDIPARLIRRDPETQLVVKRDRAELGEWRNLDFCERLIPFSIGEMLKRGQEDIVLVAGKRHRKFRRYIEDFKLLRKAGVAEPD